jgi:hypothetical protein
VNQANVHQHVGDSTCDMAVAERGFGEVAHGLQAYISRRCIALEKFWSGSRKKSMHQQVEQAGSLPSPLKLQCCVLPVKGCIL